MDKKWRTVQVPEGLAKEIEKYLKTKDADKKGIHSISAFITDAIRKQLD